MILFIIARACPKQSIVCVAFRIDFVELAGGSVASPAARNDENRYD
jgi:hypothetical protein